MSGDFYKSVISKDVKSEKAEKPVQVVTKRKDGSIRVDHMNYEKTMTQQHFAEQCDVNRIMKRWLNGGPPPVSNAARAVFKDVSHGMDYQSLLNVTMSVQDSFDSLPADMRSRFKNDPAELLDFVGNPANYDECVKLGLMDSDSPSKVDGSQVSPVVQVVEQLPT